MRVRTLFIGLAKARIRRIVSSIEEASQASLVTSRAGISDGNLSELIAASDAVFVGRDQEERNLTRLLGDIRKHHTNIPVVLTYESEPDGKSFMLSGKFDCWLFSDSDHLGRTLTPAEIGEALAGGTDSRTIEQRLFEVSRSAGPCSTGV